MHTWSRSANWPPDTRCNKLPSSNYAWCSITPAWRFFHRDRRGKGGTDLFASSVSRPAMQSRVSLGGNWLLIWGCEQESMQCQVCTHVSDIDVSCVSVYDTQLKTQKFMVFATPPVKSNTILMNEFQLVTHKWNSTLTLIITNRNDRLYYLCEFSVKLRVKFG